MGQKVEPILQYKQFRVMPTIKLNVGKFIYNKQTNNDLSQCYAIEPIYNGLAIEVKCDDEHYVVIAFVKYTEANTCTYQPIGTRIEDYCTTWEDILGFRKCLAVATEEIIKAWENKNNENFVD